MPELEFEWPGLHPGLSRVELKGFKWDHVSHLLERLLKTSKVARHTVNQGAFHVKDITCKHGFDPHLSFINREEKMTFLFRDVNNGGGRVAGSTSK
jgi:hypothetical protein